MIFNIRYHSKKITSFFLDKNSSFELSNELTKKYCFENFSKGMLIRSSYPVRELVDAMKSSEDEDVLREAKEAFEHFIKNALEEMESEQGVEL